MRRYFPLLTCLAVLVAALAAAACGGDDDAKTPAPAATSTGGGSTTAASSPAATYPMKVTDMAKRTVEIKALPKAIVAVSPTAVEMVYAAGGTVVGRSSSVDFPEAAKQATDVGSAYRPAAEKILALKPDLVIGDSSIIKGSPDLQKTLDGLGVPVLYVGAESYADVLTGLDLVGKVLNGSAKTDAVKASIEKAKNDAKAAIGTASVTIVAVTADERAQLYAAKESNYTGDILKQLGLKNPANDLPDTPPFPGFSLLAPEKLLQLNPDYILAITPDPRAPQLAGTLAKIPPFAGLKAIVNKHVIDGDVQIFLQAPGPRIADAFKAIAAAVGTPSGATPNPTR